MQAAKATGINATIMGNMENTIITNEGMEGIITMVESTDMDLEDIVITMAESIGMDLEDIVITMAESLTTALHIVTTAMIKHTKIMGTEKFMEVTIIIQNIQMYSLRKMDRPISLLAITLTLFQLVGQPATSKISMKNEITFQFEIVQPF